MELFVERVKSAANKPRDNTTLPLPSSDTKKRRIGHDKHGHCNIEGHGQSRSNHGQSRSNVCPECYDVWLTDLTKTVARPMNLCIHGRGYGPATNGCCGVTQKRNLKPEQRNYNGRCSKHDGTLNNNSSCYHCWWEYHNNKVRI